MPMNETRPSEARPRPFQTGKRGEEPALMVRRPSQLVPPNWDPDAASKVSASEYECVCCRWPQRVGLLLPVGEWIEEEGGQAEPGGGWIR